MNSLRSRILDRKLTRNILVQSQLLSNSVTLNSDAEIQIPYRIERGPTDILKALKSTISKDPTAPAYKYVDDPFFIPMSTARKRNFSLSREAGKKAAMWALQEHADLLSLEIADPVIKAYLPRAVYKVKSDVSEEILLQVIKEGRISDSLNIYELLEKNVSNETKQCLLELLCYYNTSEEPIPEEHMEERWYQTPVRRHKNTWNESKDIEELFGYLHKQDEKTAAAAYNALICGTAKYYKVSKAWELYSECEKNGIPLCTEAYNAMIHLVPLLKDSEEDRKVLMNNFLFEMEKRNINPNIGTLNSCLKTVAFFNTQAKAKELTRALLAEFKKLDIMPSLASYYHILTIFCRDGGPTSTALSEILDKLEGTKLTFKDRLDTHFFVYAMEIARNHLQSVDIGNRIHELLLSHDNYVFIGERLKESIYYRNYILLQLASLPFVDFMKIYNMVVPHTYTPEPTVMVEIMNTVEMNQPKVGMEFMPKLWSHIVIFDQLERQQLMSLVMDLMTYHLKPPSDSPANKEFAEAAWSFWTVLQGRAEKRLQRIMWPADTLANVSLLLIRGNEFENMLDILKFLVKTQDSVIGTVHPEKLALIFDSCVAAGHSVGAITLVEYANEHGLEEAAIMARKIKSTLPLSSAQENQLINLVGSETLNIKLSSDQ